MKKLTLSFLSLCAFLFAFTVPAFAGTGGNAAPGGFVLFNTQTVSAVASVTQSIPAGTKELWIDTEGATCSTGSQVLVTVSGAGSGLQTQLSPTTPTTAFYGSTFYRGLTGNAWFAWSYGNNVGNSNSAPQVFGFTPSVIGAATTINMQCSSAGNLTATIKFYGM